MFYIITQSHMLRFSLEEITHEKIMSKWIRRQMLRDRLKILLNSLTNNQLRFDNSCYFARGIVRSRYVKEDICILCIRRIEHHLPLLTY